MKDSRHTKASEYENNVHKFIKQLVADGEMPGATKHAEVHLHKVYQDAYGETINPDISIEVFRTKESVKPSLYILFECKWSDKHKVNSGDYNEFCNNIRRLNESAVKGYMVTNTGFPESVINRSRGIENGASTGVGLIVFNNNGADWIVERNLRNYRTSLKKFDILKGEVSSSSAVLSTDGKLTNFIDLLIEIGVPIKNQFTPTIPWIGSNVIREIAEQIGSEFLPIAANRPQTILKHIYPSATILYKDFPFGIYGCFDFNNDVLFISNELRNDPYRTNFTIAHEIGHIVLHQNILKQYYKATSVTQTIKPSDSVISKLEMQANTFASALLLPKDVFLIETARRMSQLDIRPPLFKDYQIVNLQDCRNVCTYLQSFFQVSRQVVEIRLFELGLLKYDKKREPKTIWEILTEPN